MNRLKKSGVKSDMPMTGISALLVIFAVLCLTVFAVLSVSTVKADQRLADRAVSQTAAWYEADGQAEIILTKLRLGEVPDGVTAAGTNGEGMTIYRYSCPLSEGQSLEAEVAVGREKYRIIRWQLVSTVDWQADENLNVWDGE